MTFLIQVDQGILKLLKIFQVHFIKTNISKVLLLKIIKLIKKVSKKKLANIIKLAFEIYLSNKFCNRHALFIFNTESLIVYWSDLANFTKSSHRKNVTFDIEVLCILRRVITSTLKEQRPSIVSWNNFKQKRSCLSINFTLKLWLLYQNFWI